jgi:hypothetical protein
MMNPFTLSAAKEVDGYTTRGQKRVNKSTMGDSA